MFCNCQYTLITLFAFIIIIYGRTDSFTFEGTYNVTISGEQRTLSVCEDNSKAIFWGLAKLLNDDVDLFNYVYAIGRDSDGTQKRNVKGKQYNIYEAEGESFWFKENELGVRTIQYYLRYNENKKYLKYTLSTAPAQFEEDPNSIYINNIYALEKESDEVLGECFMPGELSFEDRKYPLTLISDSTRDAGFGDFVVNINTDKNNACSGVYEISSNSIIDGGGITGGVNTRFEWENKLRISQGPWTNPCCPLITFMTVSEFYDDYMDYNSYLLTGKCGSSNLGFLGRFFETDQDFGECPLFNLNSTTTI